MKAVNIPIQNIVIGTRQRRDYGDIADLASSLDRYGLIQPIVLDDFNNLIAGGRRLQAAQQLGWESIPVVYFGTLTEDERMELELEENVRRKDMSWQERCLSIAAIHNKKRLNGALAGSNWGYRETGELLGMTLSNVSYALQAARLIAENDPAIANCSNMNDVVRLLLQRKEDEVLKSLATEPADTIQPTASVEVLDGPAAAPEVVPLLTIHDDSISVLKATTPGTYNHIVTDPPYAIDMDNIQQPGVGMDVSRTAAEHDVLENLTLLDQFLPLAFRATDDHAFCVTWCDFEHYDYLVGLANKVGWRVQRWPLVWVKTDPCQNGAAAFNFTKKTEVALVLRKPGATLNSVQPSNYWIGSGEDKSLFNHPFAKPRDLWRWIINAVSQPGQLILDPFAGVGTCPVACIESGRIPCAVEKNELHYNQLIENMKRAYRTIHGSNVRFS